MSKAISSIGFLCLGIGLCAIALAIYSQSSAFQVQDDAYMYSRYAQSLLRGDGMAWNPGGEPTYGATSLFYVPWVAAVSACLPGDPGRAIVMASVFGMLLALGLIATLVLRGLPRNGAQRMLAVCLVVAVLARAHRNLAAHATNGMDTGLTMSVVALLVLAWWRHTRATQSRPDDATPRNWASSLLVVLASGLALAQRPDLGLYVLGIPLVLTVVSTGPVRLEYTKLACALLLVLAIWVAWCWAYFGSPLPLSFHIKGMATELGEPFVARHSGEASAHFGRFLISFAPLWMFATLDLVSRWRGRRDPENALWLAVFAATVLHWLYYRFGVLQLVGFYQRFYYPTLPALVFLGITSLSRHFERLGGRRLDSRLWRWASAAAVIACLAVGARALVSSKGMLVSETQNRRQGRFDLKERYDIPRTRSNWYCLDGFSALGDDLVLATTEVGLLSALNPRKRVIDMVGLNESGFAWNGFDARRLCAELRPDVLYMPHPDYTTMIREIESESSFQSGYLHYPAQDLDAFMGLALRRDSPYFQTMQELVAARREQNRIRVPKESK